MLPVNFSAILGVFIILALPSQARADTPAPAAEPRHSAPGPAPRVLTLPQAYQLALRNNPTLQQMDARVGLAEAERRRAWARVNPTARLEGSYTFNAPEVTIDPTAGQPGAPPSDPIVILRRFQLGFGARAALPLFEGPAYHLIGAAKKGVRAARKRLLRARQDFMLRVASAYYLALGRHEVIKALEDQLSVDRRNLEIARVRLEVGRIVRSEQLRAELVLVQDSQALRQERYTYEAAKRRVAILVGATGAIDLAKPAEPPSPLGRRAQLLRTALNHRVDIHALELDLAAARNTKTAAWWSFLPTLGLNLLYQWQEAEGFAGQQDTLAILARVNFPVYEGGVRYAELRRARATIAQSEAARAELQRDIAENIVQLRAELLSVEAGLVAARKALTLAITASDEMTARYEAGSATQIDQLDATRRRLEAQIDLIRARYTRDLARIALAHTMGRFDPSVARR